VPRLADFSLVDLHAALDAHRHAHELSWSQAAREIGVGASTISGLRARAVAEADGVLQMLRWLRRSPESFVPDHPWSDRTDTRLKAPPLGRVLRIDGFRLHEALDARRMELGLSWPRLARELTVGRSSLTGLESGARTAFPAVMRFSGWLSRPLAEFTRSS
jgi:transcriptional regulator with XRE-family HTH domain